MFEMNAFITEMCMYKIYNQDIAHVFGGFFTYNHEVHYLDTRISNHLYVNYNSSAFNIKYQGVIIWNKILNAKPDHGSSELLKWCWKMYTTKTCLRMII